MTRSKLLVCAKNWASKSIPLDPLTALGKQIERTRGQYAAMVKAWQDAR